MSRPEAGARIRASRSVEIRFLLLLEFGVRTGISCFLGWLLSFADGQGGAGQRLSKSGAIATHRGSTRHIKDASRRAISTAAEWPNRRITLRHTLVFPAGEMQPFMCLLHDEAARSRPPSFSCIRLPFAYSLPGGPNG